MKYFIILVFLCCVDYSVACNGYTVKVTKIKNCVSDPIVKLPEQGFNIVLDKDCNIYTTGCTEITKDFKTAMGKYHFKKLPLPMVEGDFDLCKASLSLKDAPDIAKGVETLGIPIDCPVKATKICGGADKTLSLGKYKNQIGMGSGNTEIRFEVEHDVGKSCFEINFTLSKPRRG